MNETGSLPCGWTRRNFLKACGAAGALMLFPWLAYASEADDLEAKADELDAQAEAAQAQMDELSAKLDALEQQFNEALARYNEANDAHEAAVSASEDEVAPVSGDRVAERPGGRGVLRGAPRAGAAEDAESRFFRHDSFLESLVRTKFSAKEQ